MADEMHDDAPTIDATDAAPSMVPPRRLDEPSRAHVLALSQQALRDSGVKDDAWAPLLCRAVDGMLDLAIFPAMTALAETHEAVSLEAETPESAAEDADERARARLPHRHDSDSPAVLTRLVLSSAIECMPGASRDVRFDNGRWHGSPLFRSPQAAPSDSWCTVGGTFTISGASGKELRRIERVLPIVVFAALHLVCEDALIRELGCERVALPLETPHLPAQETPITLEAVRPESQAATDNDPVDALTMPLAEEKAQISAPSVASPLPPVATSPVRQHRFRTMWSMLAGSESPSRRPRSDTTSSRGTLKPERSHKRPLASRLTRMIGGRKRSATSSTSSEDDEWDVVATPNTVVASPQLPELALDVEASLPEEATSLDPHATEPMTSSEPEANNSPQQQAVAIATAEDRPGRYFDVVSKMEQVILSVSPSVHFPPPHLLVRLRQQEADEANEGPPTPSLSTMASTRSSSISLSPPEKSSRSYTSPLLDARPAVGRQRSFPYADGQTLAATFAVRHEPASDAIDGMPPTSSMDPPLSSISRASRAKMNADMRAGIASLMTGNASLAGVLQHQAISALFAFSCKASKCYARRATTMQYYRGLAPSATNSRPSSWQCADVRLGALVRALVRSRDETCDQEGCGRPLGEHAMSWLHNTARVETNIEDDSFGTASDADVQLWTSCAECGLSTARTTASDAALMCSFAKLVELIIYDSGDLVPPASPTCTHDRHQLVRHFATGGAAVHMRLGSIDDVLYELRLPRSIDAVAESTTDSNTPREANIVDRTRSDIHAYWLSIQRRIEVVRRTLVARSDSAHELKLLEPVAASFFETKQGLLQQLGVAHASSINTVRFAFAEQAHGIERRLDAWVLKHLTKAELAEIVLPKLCEPDYLRSGVYALPSDTDVLLRTEEPSSFIAFALSSREYKAELAQPTAKPKGPSGGGRLPTLSRRTSGADGVATYEDHSAPPSMPSSPRLDGKAASRTASPAPSVRSGVGSLLLPSRGPRQPVPDPDDALAAVYEPTAYTSSAYSSGDPKQSAQAAILKSLSKRRSNDLFGLWSNRSVSDPLVGAPVEGMPLPPSSLGREPPHSTPADDAELLAALLSSKGVDERAQLGVGRGPKLPRLMADLATRRHVSESTPGLAQPTLEPAHEAEFARSANTSEAPQTPSLTPRASMISSSNTDHSDEEDSVLLSGQTTPVVPVAPPTTAVPPSSVRSVFSSPLSWALGSLKLRALDVDGQTAYAMQDAQPHVNLILSHGSKEFSITAFHAAKFAFLRGMCNLSEASFIESLSRCSGWAPTGGKSGSDFFVTHDKRFVLKQMRDSFSGSEKDSMLALAAEYFAYLMDGDEHRPSLMAKIFGVYSIRVRDSATGTDTSRDIIVLEALFHGRQVTQTFDLKGIASRKAPLTADGTAPSTLFDHEFALAAPQLLLRPHSRQLILEALANDTAFLEGVAKAVDYSALVGVCEDERVLVIGLIDILSSFNLQKLIESKAKSLRKAKEDVTIIEPAEFAARFRRTIASSLLAVPEKWTAPSSVATSSSPPLSVGLRSPL